MYLEIVFKYENKKYLPKFEGPKKGIYLNKILPVNKTFGCRTQCHLKVLDNRKRHEKKCHAKHSIFRMKKGHNVDEKCR